MKNINHFCLKTILWLILLSSCKSPSTDAIDTSVLVKKLKETETTWDKAKIGAVHIENPKVTVLKIRIKAGEKLPLHKHPVLNIGYMLQGELTVYTETGQKIIIKKGDALVEVINQWHYGENTGSTDAIIVVSYLGNRNDHLTILKKPKV